MKHVKDSQLVRPQWRASPLAGWLDAFAVWVNTQGYAPRTAHGKVLLAARFSQWLEQEEIGTADINPNHAARYLQVVSVGDAGVLDHQGAGLGAERLQHLEHGVPFGDVAG